MAPVENIQPAHATQGGVERQANIQKHQAEIEQQYLQQAVKKKNDEQREQTQETKNTDKAIIREKEQRQKKKDKKNKGKDKKKKMIFLSETDTDGGKELQHVDIKI